MLSRATALWLATIATLFAAPTFAQSPAPAPLPDVEVAIAGRPADHDALLPVLRELLDRMNAHVSWSHVAELAPADVLSDHATTSVRARAWIDLRTDSARVYLGDQSSERFLVRNIALPHGMDELAREQIGQIVASSIEALLEGAEIGMLRADARAALGIASSSPPPSSASPSPSPAPPALPRRIATPAVTPVRVITVRADLELGYFAAIFAPPAAPIADGPYASIGATLGSAPTHAFVDLRVIYERPISVVPAPFGVRLDTVALRLAAGVETVVARGWALRAGAGIGVDFVNEQPSAIANGPVHLDSPRLTGLPIASISVGLRVRLVDGLALVAAIGCDADLSGTEYDAENGTTLVPVVVPWRFRPGISIGVRSTVAGGDDFATVR